MDRWLDRKNHPATRAELHYGARIIRCFVERPKSVHAMLANAVARRPTGLALICGEERLSYSELDALVGEAAAGLRALGVGKGDRVAMVLGNSIEFVVVLFAVARLGAVSVPLNTRHTLSENSHIIEDCAAKVVVHEFDLADRVPTPGAPPSLKHALAVRHEGGPMLAELRGAAPIGTAEAVGEEETATILYTSGTTGRPKGAMLTHLSIAHSVIHYRVTMGLTEDDCGLIAVPMSHVTGLIALVHAMIHCAATLVIMPTFKANEFIDLAARHQMTYTLIVPAMFNLCLLAPNFETADLSHWRVSGYGGAIMPEATCERIAEKLPELKLLNCYGATETTSPAAIMPPEQTVARKESVGLAVSCGDILVMDPEGVEAPYGQPGEIYIGGAMVVPGYFNNTQATEREFVAGYWKSGDLGIMDEKGYLARHRSHQGCDQPRRVQDLCLRGRERSARTSRRRRGRGRGEAMSGAWRARSRLCRAPSRRGRGRASAPLRRCPLRLQGPGDGPPPGRNAASQRQWQGSQARAARDPGGVRRIRRPRARILHL